jgi:hypothetical protein
MEGVNAIARSAKWKFSVPRNSQPAKHPLVYMGWPSYQMSAILKIDSPWPVGTLAAMVAYMRRFSFHQAHSEGCIFI